MVLHPRQIGQQYHKGLAYFSLLTLLLFFIPLLSSCHSFGQLENIEQTGNIPSTHLSKSDFLLDTFVNITIYDEQDTHILDGALELIRYYESIFSRTDPEAEVYAINHDITPLKELTYTVSEELYTLLQYGQYYGQLSNGAFDITMEPVTELWHFTKNTPIIPTEKAIASALPLVGYEGLRLEGRAITFAKKDMGLDVGGIAKGYIADRIKEYLLEQGVESALINLGGNILCVGSKPDGSPFRIGIQKPFADRNETATILEITDQSVVSSGIYERYFLWEGNHYHHILDSQTGYPVVNNLTSVTIISDHSVDGDALSTTCFSLGLEAGMKLVESIPDTYAVFLTTEGQLYYSQGFLDTIK